MHARPSKTIYRNRYEFFFKSSLRNQLYRLTINLTEDMGKKKVVIIDDEEDLCHLMKTYLSDLNYEVFLAYTLGSGLNLMSEVSPDIVFIDNNLPDGLGWEKMNYLMETYPNCKINLISAYRTKAPDEIPQTRAIQILEKPLSLNVLKNYL
jgi:two-component system, OmpR family, response regulator